MTHIVTVVVHQAEKGYTTISNELGLHRSTDNCVQIEEVHCYSPGLFHLQLANVIVYESTIRRTEQLWRAWQSCKENVTALQKDHCCPSTVS